MLVFAYFAPADLAGRQSGVATQNKPNEFIFNELIQTSQPASSVRVSSDNSSGREIN
jgi:hypothetical protein